MSVSASLSALESAWALSDSLFSDHITPSRALSRPISLRNPFVFYLGHLPAFTWNVLRPVLNAAPLNAPFEHLFERGIDPDVEDNAKCNSHPPPPPDWPDWRDVIQYTRLVRAAVRQAAAQPTEYPALARLLTIIAEHEVMHVETLYYMLAQHRPTPGPCCERPAHWSEPRSAVQPCPEPDWVLVRGGIVPLGVSEEKGFRWDNEQNVASASEPSFRIARHAVSVADFLRFVRAGGYHRRELWTEEDWHWVSRENRNHPASWSCAGDGAVHEQFRVLTGVGPFMNQRSQQDDFAEVLQWPVSVSLAEARAYAKWCGAALPSETQWLLAAYGEDGAVKEEGGVDVMAGKPHAVSKGRVAACGAVGLVGNGWELTTTPFEEFDGFKPTPEYPAYSADFFDGKHFVLKGASWATHSLIVRPSFRNWFQARYPFVFSKFRLVAPGVDS